MPRFGNGESHWIMDRNQIDSIADIIAESDKMLFDLPLFRDAFFANVRFDAEDSAEVEQGLSLGSLEIPRKERSAFRLLPRLPAWLLRVARIGSTFAKKTRKLVLSSSGLCIGTATDNAPSTDVVLGRVMERAWLALAAEGLSVQPMMSLLVLKNALDNGSPEVVKQLSSARIEALLHELQHVCPAREVRTAWDLSSASGMLIRQTPAWDVGLWIRFSNIPPLTEKD